MESSTHLTSSSTGSSMNMSYARGCLKPCVQLLIQDSSEPKPLHPRFASSSTLKADPLPSFSSTANAEEPMKSATYALPKRWSKRSFVVKIWSVGPVYL